jgi:hypothetical protein
MSEPENGNLLKHKTQRDTEFEEQKQKYLKEYYLFNIL